MKSMKYWQTSGRRLPLGRPLVMGILNITPDSFSDGGRYLSSDDALRRAGEMIEEGADIIDIGGESTRPGSSPVDPEDEIGRVVPVIEAIVRRFDRPVSIDTSKASVAEAAVKAGAEIINDISGLRFDPKVAAVASANGTGLVLMHSRGEFGSMHSLEPVADIQAEVRSGFDQSIEIATSNGVGKDQIVLDVGIGFGKTLDQNLALLGDLAGLIRDFAEFPFLIGTSRKSFIAKILDDAPPDSRLAGSLASAVIAVWQGASIARVHDVRQTAEAFRIVDAVRRSVD